jgi:alkylation response protein AidB-like acyl-CoA dehydrogenase
MPLFTAQAQIDAPLYRMRAEVPFFTAHAAVALGIARGAVDAFVELAQKKTPTLSQSSLASRATVHAEVARAEAGLQSARAFFYLMAGEMQTALESGPGIPDSLETRRRLACVNAAEVAQRVVDAMYRLAGTSAIQNGSMLDRCLRDIHTLNQHLSVSPVWWEKTGQSYFGQGLGMP